MNKKRVLIPLKVITLFLTLSVLTVSAKAETLTLPFSWELTKYPTEQKSGTSSFFLLEVETGRVYEMEVSLTNVTKEPISLDLEPVSSMTSAVNGGIEYISDPKYMEGLRDKTLLDPRFLASKYIKLTQRNLNLKSGETKKVKIKVDTNGMTEGTVLGGITISEDNSSKPSKNEEGLVVRTKNQLAVTIPIQLDFPLRDQKPNIEYTDVKFSYVSNAIMKIGISNHSNTIVNKVSGKYVVSNKTTKEKVFEGSYGPFKMAPKTSINLIRYWESETISEEEYSVEIIDDLTNNKKELTLNVKVPQTIIVGDTNEGVVLTPEVVYQDGKKPNDTDANHQEKGSVIKYLVVLAIIIVALPYIVWAWSISVGKKKRRNEDE